MAVDERVSRSGNSKPKFAHIKKGDVENSLCLKKTVHIAFEVMRKLYIFSKKMSSRKTKNVDVFRKVFATCSMCARVQRTFSMYGCDGRILNRLTAKTIVAGIMIPASAHAALKPSVAV